MQGKQVRSLNRVSTVAVKLHRTVADMIAGVLAAGAAAGSQDRPLAGSGTVLARG
jgi:hypothetical protein